MNHKLIQTRRANRNLAETLDFCIFLIKQLQLEARNNNRVATELVSNLNRLTKIGPPSRPTTGMEYAQVALEDNCQIAKDVLEKYGLLDPEESGAE